MAKPVGTCPVCKGNAKHLPVSGDYLELACAGCGHYRLSGTAKELLPKLSTVEKRRSLERAKLRAPYGSLPLVTSYDLP